MARHRTGRRDRLDAVPYTRFGSNCRGAHAKTLSDLGERDIEIRGSGLLNDALRRRHGDDDRHAREEVRVALFTPGARAREAQ